MAVLARNEEFTMVLLDGVARYEELPSSLVDGRSSDCPLNSPTLCRKTSGIGRRLSEEVGDIIFRDLRSEEEEVDERFFSVGDNIFLSMVEEEILLSIVSCIFFSSMDE